MFYLFHIKKELIILLQMFVSNYLFLLIRNPLLQQLTAHIDQKLKT